MNDTTHDTIRAKVRKLLNLAEGSTHDGEIENALRFAQQLMDEHQLSRAQILDDDPDSAEAIHGEQMAREAAEAGGANLSGWEGVLAMAVCQAVGSVQCYRDRSRNGRTAEGLFDGDPRTGEPTRRGVVQFFGIAEDVALAVELFTDTRKTIATMARLKFGGVYRGPGRSYCEGFASALNRQAEQQTEERIAQCTAIILATESKALAWLKETHDVKIGASGGSQRGGRHFCDANDEGKADGQRCGFSANRRAKLTSGNGHARLT